jgi:gluconokinase
LLPHYRARWPALNGVPFLPTVGDGVGSNIGSDCTTSDRVALAVGTSGAMRVLLEGAPEHLPDGLWSYRVDRRRTLLGGAVSNGTNVPEWLAQTLKLPPPDMLETALGAAPADGHGLTVLPLLAGERSPGWADDATATFSGLRLSTQPLGIFQAAMEAVAYRFALILRALGPHLPAQHSIVASGRGALASPAWTQIMADVFGRPVIVSVQKSATARGIALLALDALGMEPLGRRPLAAATTFQPRPERHAIYAQALERHVRLYTKLIGGIGN